MSSLSVLSSCTQTSRDSLGTPSGGIVTKSGCSLLIGCPVLNACCTSPNCNLCLWLHTDCKTVIKPSQVSVGECDSMSRRSGLVKTLNDESCLRTEPRLHAFVWLPSTCRVSIVRAVQCDQAWAVSSRENTLAAWFLSRVCYSTSMLFRNSRFSAGDNWFIFTSVAFVAHQARL